MTPGQKRALQELNRIQSAAPEEFEVVGSPEVVNGRLQVAFSLRLGPMEMKEGGLNLRDREDFILFVPPDFPFEYPTLKVNHERFGGFPHVVWSKTICVYQSKIEWNPADGLYGFFDRVKMWLGKAAINEMDSVDGPLEPPHHITDFSQRPFVIRTNAPVEPGELWLGLAELEKHENRIELVGWNNLTESWPEGRFPALAIVLPKPLPMEFPEKGADFFKELVKQGLTNQQILKNLALASLFSSEGDPIHLVMGMPMRRAADGSPRLHIAVWTTDAEFSKSLHTVLSKEGDTEAILALRQELADLMFSMFENAQIKWCRVLEGRKEVVVRRDGNSPIVWFADKRVLILGCGALGSWIAESIARANPQLLHIVDNSIVKPGLLARQNYLLQDIGSNKAEALEKRLQGIIRAESIQHFVREAHNFITEVPERFGDYDVVVDCTASSIFQMKLERDWRTFGRRSPTIISMLIDANAQRCIGVVVGRNAETGIWDAYLKLKYRISGEGKHVDTISAFYTDRATNDLFQPEPGCSDPTFSGSTADVYILGSTALNIATSHINSVDSAIGIAFSAHDREGHAGTCDILKLAKTVETVVGQYRVRIDQSVYHEARAWVRKNDRIRSRQHETGGLLWGLWNDVLDIIWIFHASGPPPDSLHDPGQFVCGVEGTIDEHERRFRLSLGVVGFIGFWHTHPGMPSKQSLTDMSGMAGLVARVGQNRKKAIMLIFGRTEDHPTVGVHIYESSAVGQAREFISVGVGQIALGRAVV